jgi:hypothetical protein
MKPYVIERLVRIWHEGEILKSKANKKGIDPFRHTHVLGFNRVSWELCEILKSSQAIERGPKEALTDSDMGNVIASGSTKDLFAYPDNNRFRVAFEGNVLELVGNSDYTTGRENRTNELLMKHFCRVHPTAMAFPVDDYWDFARRIKDREPREIRIAQRGAYIGGVFREGIGIPESRDNMNVVLYVDDQGMRLLYTGDTSKPPVIFDQGYAALLKVEVSGHERGFEDPGVWGFGRGVVGSVKAIVAARIVNEVFTTETPPSCSLRVIFQDAMFRMQLRPTSPKALLAFLDGVRVYLETERLKQERSDKTALTEMSRMEELGRAAELRDKGVLTDEEFEFEKSRILGTQ